jgi:hypothetical protein
MKKAVLVLAAVMFFGSTAFTATQGTLGATSTGDFTITVTIPERVQVSYLQDIDFGSYGGSGALTDNYDLCVYSNTGGYQITATGSGAANAFTITDGSDTIAYTLSWNDTTTTTGNQSITTGTALTGQTTAAADATCSSGSSMSSNMYVNIAEAALLAATPSATPYSGTVTLLVEPE